MQDICQSIYSGSIDKLNKTGRFELPGSEDYQDKHFTFKYVGLQKMP